MTKAEKRQHLTNLLDMLQDAHLEEMVTVLEEVPSASKLAPHVTDPEDVMAVYIASEIEGVRAALSRFNRARIVLANFLTANG